MVRRLSTPIALAVLVLLAPAARAMTLGEAFEAARVHDPQFSAAAHELEAARQGVPIARAALLPQVSFSYSNFGVSGTREFPNALQQEVTTRVEYASPQASLSMRVPLFNYEAWMRLDQATMQTRGAEAVYRARGLDLVERLSSAYLSVLELRSQAALADVEVVALAEQLRRAEQRFKRGEGTRIDEAVARSALESARARVGDLAARVNVALTRLARMTGRAPGSVQDTSPDFRPMRAEPGESLQWIEAARAQNPTLEARQAAVDAARLTVRRNQAGHLPRVDLVGSVQRSQNDSLANLDQRSFLRSVGVQLSLPLYSGGGVDASVRQSQAEVSRAEEDLRTERENIELEILRQLQTADGAAARAEALRKAVEAGEVAVLGATRAQEAGLGTQSDLLDARARLFGVRRELAQAQYEHLAARMRMMLFAGEPMQRVVDRIGALLPVRAAVTFNDPAAKAP